MAARRDGWMAKRQTQPSAERAMKKTTLNIPKDIHQKIRVLAIQRDRQMGAVVTEALEKYLREQPRDKK